MHASPYATPSLEGEQSPHNWARYQLIRDALSLPPFSRDEAAWAIESLACDSLDPDDRRSKLARLYARLLPAPQPAYKRSAMSRRTDAGDWAWVRAAVAEDSELRVALRYVHAQSGKLLATNGHRIHIATLRESLPDGIYDPASQTRLWPLAPPPNQGDHPGRFPSWEVLFRDCPTTSLHRATWKIHSLNEIGRKAHRYILITDADGGQELCRETYWLEAIAGMTASATLSAIIPRVTTASGNWRERTLLICDGNRQASIMPVGSFYIPADMRSPEVTATHAREGVA